MDWEYREYYECREAHNEIQNAKFKMKFLLSGNALRVIPEFPGLLELPVYPPR